ncbi:MAG: TonB-dependent receptor [Bacteroidota bacterium]
MYRILFPVLTLLWYSLAAQQPAVVVNGKVRDALTGAGLESVNIIIQGTTQGTATNSSGAYSIQVPSFPVTLVFSMVGYETVNRRVERAGTVAEVLLSENIILGQEVVVSASRAEENIMRSPVTVEKIGLNEIRQMPVANFYDGLYMMKGVDMVNHGLLFRLPNTRGFNGPTNIRMNQLVDGMDNAPPGLNFSAGNIFGINQTDIESVELLPGATSALYGPGGMNGTLLMTSKNPFDYQGLSTSTQLGMMHLGADYRKYPAPMGDFNLRYAASLSPRAAWKVTVGYIRAEDWHAADFRDRTNLTNPFLSRATNAGYDGVNVYGDDVIVPVNLKNLAPNVADAVALSQGYVPGTSQYQNLYDLVISKFPDQLVTRTGFSEKDLVDYGTKNFRVNSALHYKVTDKAEFITQAGYGNGTSVYTMANRFSLRNFQIGNMKLELKHPDYYLRAYGVAEFSGNTYDAGSTGLLMNEAWKPSEQWYTDFVGAFTQQVLLGDNQQNALRFARLVADNRDEVGNVFNGSKPAIPVPGTQAYRQLFKEITSRTVNNGGTKVLDKSKLLHAEGMYNFSRLIKVAEVMVGASARLYAVDSDGTIFIDKPNEPLLIRQYGAFTQIGKRMLCDRLRVTGAARYDKNEYFKGRFTPRLGMVFTADKENERNIRVSWQTAFRFPTIADQWVNLNASRYQVIGGQQQVQDLWNFRTNPVYPLSGTNPITDQPVTSGGPFRIPAFGPERVRAWEVGYKGLHFNRMVMLDAYAYRNLYNGFLATQTLAQNPFTPQERRFQTTISTDFPVVTWGWALGADVVMPRGFLFRSNVNYNDFRLDGTPPTGFQSQFNTPAYRFNCSVSNRKLWRNTGMSLNYRWQQKFLWESNFGAGTIPAFGTLDLTVTVPVRLMNSQLKIGGTNLLNRYYTTNFGSAQIGAMYFVTWVVDKW